MRINFLLIGEGTSDLRLIDHIESIFINEGFTEVSGEAPDLGRFTPPAGRDTKSKIGCLLKHFPNFDAIFIHRDADNSGAAAREREIADAAAELISLDKVIPVIPVTMLETWLLADIDILKRVAGNLNYKGIPNNLPPINRLESVKDSKQLLLDTLCTLSETQGARLQKFKKRFPEMRARLTYDLDPNGPINELSSYREFRARIKELSNRLLNP
ncbi:DUF4276 family protein [Stutzerimonas stutzeri]|uniref:DUF4276 family protein n=1 Tax=Stutzerimonas stutzeri TaxID=316 RepID=UPI00210DBF53|nr:DUF4276 family protein [Stutzerimonas stutzeri]MCQ4261161.1 DUF4276 family protein [Stutzerimonas stutzeri]